MTSITTFQEIMKGLPRGVFGGLVHRHNADKYVKTFGHWDHLIAMLYAQFTNTTGLRELVNGFNSHASKHYHLGTGTIRRTTLAKANETRGDLIFRETVSWLIGKMSRSLRKDTQELLFLLDSTSITLKGREFDHWTTDTQTRNTQGIKLHMLIDSVAHSPAWYDFSAANVNDVQLARSVPLEAGATYVFDKGYCDYNWWYQIDMAGAKFVTRFKKNAGLKVVEQRPVSPTSLCVLKDEIVRFKRKYPSGTRVNLYDKQMRCVTIARPEKATPLVLATNDLTSPAEEIANRYKDRWAIELFFKWIKQHLKIKQFLGRSENAVRIQILTALISYLLIALYKISHGLKATLWECLCLIRATLFQRIDQQDSAFKRRRRETEEYAQKQGGLFA